MFNHVKLESNTLVKMAGIIFLIFYLFLRDFLTIERLHIYLKIFSPILNL